MVGPMVNLRLAGLASVAANSQDLLEMVDEVGIAHEKSLYVDPIARLALGVCQLALAVDAHNRRREETSVTPASAAAPYEGPKPAPSQRPDNLVSAECGLVNSQE